ncbi:MAG: methylenetetrahydrofolate reductase [Candidatus Dormibacteria bacterium]
MPSTPGGFTLSAEALPPRHASLDTFRARAARLATAVDSLQVPDSPGAVSRVAALAAALALARDGIVAWPSVSPRDRGLEALAADLRAARSQGIGQALIVSGDRGGADLRTATVLDVARLGKEVAPLRLGVTVAPGAADLDRELDRCQRRAEAGAAFALTQYLFTPGQAHSFWSAWSAHPVSGLIPCRLATGPVPSRASLERIWRLGAVVVPESFATALTTAPDFAAEARTRFLETVAALAALPGAGGVHLYTAGDLDLVIEAAGVARQVSGLT